MANTFKVGDMVKFVGFVNGDGLEDHRSFHVVKILRNGHVCVSVMRWFEYGKRWTVRPDRIRLAD